MSENSEAVVSSTMVNQNLAYFSGAGISIDGSSTLKCTQCNISGNIDHNKQSSNVAATRLPAYYCAGGSRFGTYDEPVCIACSPGLFSAHVTAEPFCSLCPGGRYQNESGQVSCIVCPTSKFQTQTGQSNCSVCEPCPDTRIPPAGCRETQGGSCTDCPPGKFANTEEQHCSLCPENKYANTTNAKGCTYCPSGKYQDSRGISF